MFEDNYPNTIESPRSLFVQYSHDILFDYSTGKWPTGNETTFDWENNYIPQDHVYNGKTVGPHVWRREKLGLNGTWSYPQPFAINNANIEAFANGSLSYFDLRYYTKTQLETNLINIAGDQLDSVYYTQTDIENNFETIVGDQLDIRYFTKTYLENNLLDIAGTQLDSRYFVQSEFLTTSAGATDSGSPIVLDADGNVDATMINDADISHLNITNIGSNNHVVIDSHIADLTIHFNEASINHTAIQNIGSNSHTVIDSHIADTTIHFAMGSINHTALLNIGSNSHTTIDSHIADGAIHFTEASIDHTSISNIGSNSHSTIDSHISDTTIHFTEGSIDHGSISGLAGDDHTQYLNNTRGDVRYYTKTLLDGGQLDTRYYTETEVNSLLTGYSLTSHVHSLLTNGTGLTGSNYNGGAVATWSVVYAGSGSANSASRSDHDHIGDGSGSTSITGLNGWDPIGNLYVFKQPPGNGTYDLVTIVGFLDKSAADLTAFQSVATLPVGYRPAQISSCLVSVTYSGGTDAWVPFRIASNGVLTSFSSSTYTNATAIYINYTYAVPV